MLTLFTNLRGRQRTEIAWLVACLALLFCQPGRAEENLAAKIRPAVEKSLALLQSASPIFLKNTGCVSCHHQALPMMAAQVARSRGFRVDEKLAAAEHQEIVAYLKARRQRILQQLKIPGDETTHAYILLGLDAAGHKPDAVTDAVARSVKINQRAEGYWRPSAHRPPLEYSLIPTTAVSLRVVSRFAPPSRKAEYERSVRKAIEWLSRAEAVTTDEHAFRLLGLGWGGADRAAIEGAAEALLRRQQTDGGWSQAPSLPSDAYATGLALVALHQAGRVPVDGDAYRRGVNFLLSTQLEDGSWLVKSRSLPFQPYFESGFPHGSHQWISAAGTSWAATALALYAPVRVTASR